MITERAKALELLVDVTSLSKKLCKIPIITRLAYATQENFIGKVISGYHQDNTDTCLMTKKPAQAMCKIQNYILQQDLSLYIYDAYRPLQAVEYFTKWFNSPVRDKLEIERKKIHYPNIDKKDLSKLGYVSGDTSRHNFGHVVDLGLLNINTNEILPMGACFDFFDEISHLSATAEKIGDEAYSNRELLSMAMQKHDFIPYEKEFWHFDFYRQEAEAPINIPITKELTNINTD
ncbi:MAG: peptidase M15 [Legionellales bacterium]|nr:peptidase M15 [Legionellales bacterium]